jgi:membrane protein
MQRRLLSRIVKTSQLWSYKGGTFMAASQSFHFAVAFFPIVLVAVSIVGLILKRSDILNYQRNQLLALVSSEGSEALSSQLETLLEQVQKGAAVSTPLGIAVLGCTLISIFYHMQKSFDLVWGIRLGTQDNRVKEIRDYVLVEVIHFVVWLGLVFLMLALFTLSVASSVWLALPRHPNLLLEGLTIILSLSATTVVFTLLYRLHPRGHVHWIDAFAAAAIGSIFWEVARQLLAVVLTNGRYSAYGVVGSFLAVMIWLYVGNSILYLGAMFVRATQLERIEHDAS